MLISEWPGFIFPIGCLCVYVYRGPGWLGKYLPEAFDCISLTLGSGHLSLQWFSSFCNYFENLFLFSLTSGWPNILILEKMPAASGPSARRAEISVRSSRWDFLNRLISTAYGDFLALVGEIEEPVIVSVNHRAGNFSASRAEVI